MDFDEFISVIAKYKLILLGGMSRSGKSTIVRLLQQKFHEKGIHVTVLNIDDYLGGPGYISCVAAPPGTYPIEKEMEMKFEYGRLVSDVKALLAGEAVRPPIYDRPSKRRITEHRDQPLLVEDILLVEGSPVLAVPGLRALDACRIYLEADYDERAKELLHDWIVVKGLTPEEADGLLRYRQRAEEPFIASTKQSAHIFIKREKGSYSIEAIDRS